MKVLWVGDAVVSTGFALCTHKVCDVLHAMGHEVHVLGINYFGDPHPYPYAIYPAVNPTEHGHDVFGCGRLPHLVAALKPDVVVLLNDPWNIPAYVKSVQAIKTQLPDFQMPKFVAWCAVDSDNQKGWELNGLLDRLIVWTDYAAQEMVKGGYKAEIDVVPLGVDTELFTRKDRDEARKVALGTVTNLPEDPFIVGVVGRNQPRKRLDLTLRYFSSWLQREKATNAILYFHVAPTGEMGVDIASLTRYYNLTKNLIVHSPRIGPGVDPRLMPYVYSAFDVYMTTTQGEGWGLPCMEAMACGVPCIVPKWSALGDWTKNAAIQVQCTSTALTAPLNANPYTIGGIMDEESFCEEMSALYRSPIHRSIYSRRGAALVREERFQWNSIGTRFEGIIRAVTAPSEATLEPAEKQGDSEVARVVE